MNNRAARLGLMKSTSTPSTTTTTIPTAAINYHTVDVPCDDVELVRSKYHPACFTRGRKQVEKANDQRLLLFVPTEAPHSASEKIIFTKRIIKSL